MSTIILSRAEDAPRILAAFRAGKLLKQRYPTATCAYRGRGNTPCAIGVVLTCSEAAMLDKADESIAASIADGKVEADDPEWFDRVQGAHDACDWVTLEALLTPPNNLQKDVQS